MVNLEPSKTVMTHFFFPGIHRLKEFSNVKVSLSSRKKMIPGGNLYIKVSLL